MLDMHPPILEVRRPPGGVAAAAIGAIAALFTGLATAAEPVMRAAPPSPECPMKARTIVEHFVGADCLACWTAGAAAAGDARIPGAEPPADGGWSLDWVVPSAAENAPLAVPAIPEAAERLARLGPHLPARLESPPAGFDTSTELDKPDAARRLWIHSSLPWNGYFGVQMHARGHWPDGTTAWVGLVEILPAGVDGSVIERRLVRVLTGPVALPKSAATKDAVDPLFGMRWPPTAQPERIVAVAWVEGRDGRILQIASDRCVDPK
jgi:hypothetical protein